MRGRAECDDNSHPMRHLIALTLSTAVVLGLSACGKEKLVVAACRLDDDCQAGYLCENYECVPKEAKACEFVGDGTPILQPSPHAVDFGTLDSQGALLQTVMLHNIGNCTLTLFEANLKDKGAGFTCDFCDGAFPKEIFPGRSLELSLAYTPSTVQAVSSELVLLSDDKEYPTLRVPIHANYIGTPGLVAAPNPVDFGYAAESRLVRKTVQLTNQGTGSAPISITSIALSPSNTDHFSFVMPMDLPKSLVPVSSDRTAMIPLEVRYHPRSLDVHKADLVITTSKGTVTVPLSGTSATPPKITVNPAMIDLGDVALGTSKFKTLTITNEGGAPLTVKQAWGGANPTTDLYTTPQNLAPIDSGKYTEMQVAVTATQQGPYSGLLILTTNDPAKQSITIPVTANGVPGAGAAVVKVEMTLENGSDTLFDNDVRNVDMTLEHPFGYVCNKQTPNPMNWGNYGTPSWLAFAPKEEPERIILADAKQDGTWRVMISYQQDCASLPTDLLAGLLGISVDVLVDYLSGGAVPLNGGDVANLIQNICLSKKSSAVNVKVFVNGMMIAERNASVGKKGDTTYVLDLVRTSGTFTVR